MTAPMDHSPFLDWLPLVRRLIESRSSQVVVYFKAFTFQSPAEAPLARICQQAGCVFRMSRIGESVLDVRPDFVLLDVEPSWPDVHRHLVGLDSGDRDRPFPATLVPRLGEPYARCDTYIKAGRPSSRRQAELAHPFQNGTLTAVEDFLRDSPPTLRFLHLPGFEDLGVLAPQVRIEEHAALDELFRHPGDVLLDLGLIADLESARQHASLGRPGGFVSSEARHVTVLRADLRRHASMLLQLRGLVRNLLDSNRWRWGNRIGDLYLKLRGRPKTETVEPQLRYALAEIDTWNLQDRIVGSRSWRDGAPPDKHPDGDAQEDDRFHRCIRQLDLDPEDERSLTLSEAEVKCKADVDLSTNPLVSVILPTHNRAALMMEAIGSVKDQTYDHWQLVICDDASEDDTEARGRALDDPRIEYLRIPRSGAAAARNRAREHCRGALVAYLDSDNLWHPQFLRIMVAALLEKPSYAAAFSRYLDVEIDGVACRLRATPPPEFDYERLLQRNYIDLNSLVHRRELYDLLGGFDETLERLQDWDLILKYGYVGDLLPVENILAIYRQNRDWDQITHTQEEGPARKRIRAKMAHYGESGGPQLRQTPASAVHLVLVEGCESRHARAEALARILAAHRTVRRSSFQDASGGDLVGQALRNGETVYVMGPAQLGHLVEPAEDREGGLLLHDLGPAMGEGEPIGRFPADATVVTALTPATVPPGSYYMPPCILEQEVPDFAVQRSTKDVAIFVCREQPGVDSLARAVEAQLRQADYRLLDGKHEDELPAETDAVVVLPRNGSGLSERVLALLLQAFRRRVPVVASPSGPLRQPVEAGCVYGAYESDPAAWVEALERFLRHQDGVPALTERANRWYRRRFSPRAVQTSFDLLAAMAAQRTRR